MLIGLLIYPPFYVAMKRAAIGRHILWQVTLEGGRGDLRDTWHQSLINLVYPL